MSVGQRRVGVREEEWAVCEPINLGKHLALPTLEENYSEPSFFLSLLSFVDIHFVVL